MDTQPKQQIIEELRSANNVLIAVRANPSVDDLSAAIGLTLALNKLEKHATTVFSGLVPSTIEFLQPEKLIETNTDSLRDFIIALDKSKADKLRYKVEDDVVRIFITPFKSSITEKDLEFSQGDFNIDLVIALGVSKRDDLDAAITAHGRILHDATVVSLTNKSEEAELGSVHWQDDKASSLCEMVAVMTSEIRTEPLFDGQMATAYLTGIVAETSRFKNDKTTPRALSISSQLMSYGANQQLIAQELEKPEFIPEESTTLRSSMDMSVGENVDVITPPVEDYQDSEPPIKNEPTDVSQLSDHEIDMLLNGGSDIDGYGSKADHEPKTDGSLMIEHEKDENLQEIHVDDSGEIRYQKPENSNFDQTQNDSFKLNSDINSGQSPYAPTFTTLEQPVQGNDVISPMSYEASPNPAENSNPTSIPQMPTPLMGDSGFEITPQNPKPSVSMPPPPLPPLPPLPPTPERPNLDSPNPVQSRSENVSPPSSVIDHNQMPSPLQDGSEFNTPPENSYPTAHATMRHEKVLVPPTLDHNNGDKIVDIEARVDSHEPVIPVIADKSEDIEMLRDSVAKAADAVVSKFPSPKHSLAASPLELTSPLPQDKGPKPPLPPMPTTSSGSVPPPVPPPMMPQVYNEVSKNSNPSS